jgi:hypothetical protein
MSTLKDANEVRARMCSELTKQGMIPRRVSEFLPKTDTLSPGSFPIEEPCKYTKNLLTIQNLFWTHSALTNFDNYWS